MGGGGVHEMLFACFLSHCIMVTIHHSHSSFSYTAPNKHTTPDTSKDLCNHWFSWREEIRPDM